MKNITIQNKNCIQAYLLSSEIHLRFNNHNDAKKNLENALRINPQSVYALFNLGKIYLAERNYDSAIQSFRYAEELKESNGMVIERTKGSYEITGEKIPPDINYAEIIFYDAVACFYGNYLLDASNRFKYCIIKKEKLDKSYFFRGLIYLQIKYYEDVCTNMKLANEHGNKEANGYILKYCKKKINLL